MTMMTTTTTMTTATTTTWLLVVVTTVLLAFGGDTGQAKLRYLKGDILETPDTLGHDGSPYPREFIERLLVKENRRGRTLHPTMDPALVSRRLLRNFEAANEGRFSDVEGRAGRGISDAVSYEVNGVKANVKVSAPPPSHGATASNASTASKGGGPKPTCESGSPSRLCPTRYNTTAPMYGVSLTSGQPVTIVQKFPDLLQQVIFEVCETDECDLVRGSCVQTYVPYLFLVIPLGPVTLTGQDYVLVESGCVCQPKSPMYNKNQPSPTDAISG